MTASRAPRPSDAFDLAYRSEFAFVWRVLRYHGVPAELVEDAVQEVFMVVHRRWDHWISLRSPRAWLFAVARKVAATSRRGAERQLRKRTAVAALVSEPPRLDARVEDRETLRRLARVLADMDDKLAAVFMLADIEGHSAPEIAAQLGTKLNTVYWHIRTARTHVHDAMDAMDVIAMEVTR